MAAATESLARDVIMGAMRGRCATLTFAGNGDTYDTGLRTIFSLAFTPTTNTAFGFTVSNGTVTIVSGGAATGVLTALGN
jgi:hypothetical protein